MRTFRSGRRGLADEERESPDDGDVSLWVAYAKTFATQGVGLALGAVAIPIVARKFGPAGFGQYSIFYTLLAVLQPALLAGLGVALPRYVARARQSRTGTHPTTYVAAAFAAEGLLLIVVLAVAGLGARLWVEPVFGGQPLDGAPFILVALVASSVTWALVTGYYRGLQDHSAANHLMVWYTGISPLVAAVLCSSVVSFFLILSALWLVGSLAVLRPWRLEGLGPGTEVRATMGRLLSFGVRRVPGELGLFGLFALPTLIAARTAGLRSGGYVAFAVSVVTILGTCFVPVSQVLLPHVSGLAARDRHQEAWAHLRRALPASFALALVLTAAIEVVAPTATRIYLGEDFVAGARITRIIALAVPGYVLFIVTRSVLDAIYLKAVSLRGPMVALAVFLGLLLVGSTSVTGIAVAFAVAVNLMGILTLAALMIAFRAAGRAP